MQDNLAPQQQMTNGKINRHFLCDVLCFFAGLQSGQVDNYCYSESLTLNDPVQGGHCWEEFIKKHTGYYPYYDETALISQNLDKVVKLCEDTHNFIELGVGSVKAFKNKTLPLLQRLAPVQYHGVDLNEEFLVNVLDYLKEQEPFIQTTQGVFDFFERMPELKANSTIYLTGTTISNIKADLRYDTVKGCLTKTLRHFGDALNSGGRFIFTYDANQEEEAIHQSYAHEAMAKHNTNFISLIARDLPTSGLYEEDFEHSTEWVAKHHLLKQCLRVKEDIQFDIAGHSFNLKEGATLHVTNCFKFTDDIICHASKSAGFSDIKICKLDGSPMRLAILEKQVS